MQLAYVYGAYGVAAFTLLSVAGIFFYQHFQLSRKIKNSHDT